MDREQQPEFEQLRAAALGQLQEGDWRLRLSILPSFGDPQVAGARRLSRDELASQSHAPLQGLIAERRVWRVSTDHTKLATPVERLRHPRKLEPTVEISTTSIDPSWLANALSDLQHLTIPALPASNVIGFDGTAYEVLAHSGNHWSQFHWWSDHPAPWRPLMNWFDATWHSLEGILLADAGTDPR